MEKNLHYQNALYLIKKNNISEALKELKLSLKFNPNSTAALNLIALTYYLKCRFDKAEKHWRKSLEIRPENNKARDYIELITKKDFYELRKQYKEILFNDKYSGQKKIDFLKEVISQYPELIEPYIILGVFYKKQRNFSKALEYLYQAYELDSGNQNIKDYIFASEKHKEGNFKSFLTKIKNIDFSFLKKSLYLTAISAFIVVFFIFTIFYQISSVDSSENNSAAGDNNNTVVQEENLEAKVDWDSVSFERDNYNPILDNDDLELENTLLQQRINELELKQAQLSRAEPENINEENSKYISYLEEGREQELFEMAMEEFSLENYQQAAEIYSFIYDVSSVNYLQRESLFLLARSQEHLENYQAAEKSYRLFLEQYPESNYYEIVLYNLGLMFYNEQQISKSRNILLRLRNEKPDSIYNNSKVYEILAEN